MTATTHTTPLRQRLIEQMQIANLADTTRECYVREIRRLAEHYGQSPDRLDAEHIRAWIMILIERGLSPATVNVTIAAFRFFFRDTLGARTVTFMPFWASTAARCSATATTGTLPTRRSDPAR